ncbi:hypothetical protein IWZ01DRAFT_38185 [Phyllosticta capitalensis]
MVAASSATVLCQAALNQKLLLIPEELKLVAVASAPPSTTRFQATGRLWQSKMLNRTALALTTYERIWQLRIFHYHFALPKVNGERWRIELQPFHSSTKPTTIQLKSIANAPSQPLRFHLPALCFFGHHTTPTWPCSSSGPRVFQHSSANVAAKCDIILYIYSNDHHHHRDSCSSSFSPPHHQRPMTPSPFFDHILSSALSG